MSFINYYCKSAPCIIINFIIYNRELLQGCNNNLLAKDAEAAARKLLAEVDENGYKAPSNETFSAYTEFWFTTHYKKRIKESTAEARMYLINKHLIRENPFSDKPLSKITTEDIDSFYNLKLDEGYSPSTIRKIHQMIHQSLEQAVTWGKIKINPATKADPPSVTKEEMKIWSIEEIRSFLEHCKDERHYITFLLGIYSGMRRGEILGKDWASIDFKKKVIRVRRSLTHVEGIGYVVKSTLINKKSLPTSSNSRLCFR